MRLAVVMSVFVLGLAFGACKKDAGVVGDVEAWSSAACACKDKACAEKQSEEFNKLEKKHEAALDKMDEATEKKVETAYEKGNACLEKFDVHAG